MEDEKKPIFSGGLIDGEVMRSIKRNWEEIERHLNEIENKDAE